MRIVTLAGTSAVFLVAGTLSMLRHISIERSMVPDDAWISIKYSGSGSNDLNLNQSGKGKHLLSVRGKRSLTLSPPARKKLKVAASSATPDPAESSKNPLFVRLRTNGTTMGAEFRCSSCAIVSASGYLLNSSSGDAIDARDCVIRINTSPVNGFERDVGARTTMRFVSHVSAKWFHDDRRFLPVLSSSANVKGDLRFVVLTTPREYPDGAKAAGTMTRVFNEEMIKDSTTTAEVYVTTKAAFVDMIRQWRAMTNHSSATTSTGYRAVYFARHFCNSITMFGFLDADWCRRRKGARRHRYPYHYYVSSKLHLTRSNECDVYQNLVRLNRANHQHDFIEEKRVFKALALVRRPPIDFVRPKWDLSLS